MPITGNLNSLQGIDRVRFVALVIGFSKIAGALISMFTAPFFIHGLGIAAWGFVSLQLTLQVLLSWCEFGLPAAAAKELSQQTESRRPNYFGALDAGMLVSSMSLLIVLQFLSPMLAEWTKVTAFPPGVALDAVRLIALGVCLNLHSVFYVNCAIGISLQEYSSVMQLGGAVLRATLGLAAVNYTHDMRVFLASQIIATALANIALRRAICSKLGVSFFSFSPDLGLLQGLKGFVLSMTLINFLLGLAQQIDRVFILKLTGLREVGLYAIAGTASLPVMMAGSTLTTAAYGDLCRQAMDKQGDGLADVFQRTQRLVLVVTGCAFAVFLSAGDHLLGLWLGRAQTDIDIIYTLAVGMCLYWLLFCSNQLYAGMFAAMNRAGSQLRRLCVSLSIYMALLLGLIYMWGLFGAVLASVSYMFIAHTLNTIAISRHAPRLMPQFNNVLPLVLGLGGQIAMGIACRSFGDYLQLSPMWTAVLTGGAVISFSIFLAGRRETSLNSR